jgi:hypothetical protein
LISLIDVSCVHVDVLIPQVQSPLIAPEEGTYRRSIDVTITCPSEGDEVVRKEGVETNVISSSIRVEKTTELNVACRRDGWEECHIQSMMYRILPAQ